MNRNRDTKKTLQDQPQESKVKTTQSISLPSGIRPQTIGYNAAHWKILQDVQQRGWHVVIYGNRCGAPFAYSIGLYQTLGQPEICIVGQPEGPLMPDIINDIGALMKKGVKFEEGLPAKGRTTLGPALRRDPRG